MGLQPEEFSAAVSAVTAAFGDPTRRDIYLLVRAGTQGMTAAEVAEHFELHPNVARHHLEKLTAGGYLTVELARHESAGRPSKRYRRQRARHHADLPARAATTCSPRCWPVRSSCSTPTTPPPWPTRSATSTAWRSPPT